MVNDRRTSLPDTVLSSGVTEEEGRAEDAIVAPPGSQMHPGLDAPLERAPHSLRNAKIEGLNNIPPTPEESRGQLYFILSPSHQAQWIEHA
ncbi:hypothetical protein TNCV_2316931 [Trichonephila clavipes]|nr:hypothetical protein TNCV_2316931 [Trichonephila clavipes]